MLIQTHAAAAANLPPTATNRTTLLTLLLFVILFIDNNLLRTALCITASDGDISSYSFSTGETPPPSSAPPSVITRGNSVAQFTATLKYEHWPTRVGVTSTDVVAFSASSRQ